MTGFPIMMFGSEIAKACGIDVPFTLYCGIRRSLRVRRAQRSSPSSTYFETTLHLPATSYDVKRMVQTLQKRRARERGFSLIELLIVIAIILIILSIALPQMSKSRMNAQEMAAVATLHTINAVETQYMSQFGQFATSLGQLGPAGGGGTTEGPNNANLIPGSLASGSSGGYNYTITGTPTNYSVSAMPKAFGSTGRRTFFTDQSGIIRQNWTNEPANDKSEELK